MGLRDLLNEQLKTALKEKDIVRKNSLRMALSSIKNAEIDGQKELDDASIINILQKEIKTREETILEARKANRDDMIDELSAEIEVLKEFLPTPLTDKELLLMVKRIILETGAESIKDMGKVMKATIQEAGGRATNDKISSFIKEILSGG